MARHDPILVTAKTAAALLDMTLGEFLRLVEAGHLPPAKRIGGLERWNVDDLRSIARGDAMNGEGMSW